MMLDERDVSKAASEDGTSGTVPKRGLDSLVSCSLVVVGPCFKVKQATTATEDSVKRPPGTTARDATGGSCNLDVSTGAGTPSFTCNCGCPDSWREVLDMESSIARWHASVASGATPNPMLDMDTKLLDCEVDEVAADVGNQVVSIRRFGFSPFSFWLLPNSKFPSRTPSNVAAAISRFAKHEAVDVDVK